MQNLKYCDYYGNMSYADFCKMVDGKPYETISNKNTELENENVH